MLPSYVVRYDAAYLETNAVLLTVAKEALHKYTTSLDIDWLQSRRFFQSRPFSVFQVIPTFDSMGLREDLLRGIYAYGFEKPSAIQQRAIKPVSFLLLAFFAYLGQFPLNTAKTILPSSKFLR